MVESKYTGTGDDREAEVRRDYLEGKTNESYETLRTGKGVRSRWKEDIY